MLIDLAPTIGPYGEDGDPHQTLTGRSPGFAPRTNPEEIGDSSLATEGYNVPGTGFGWSRLPK